MLHLSVKVRHTLYNIIGITAQIAAVVVVVPIYVDYIGWIKYGVFMLLITLLNYSRSMGRGVEEAVKKYCASANDGDNVHYLNELFWSSLFTAFLFSLGLGVLTYTASYWLINNVFTLTLHDKQQAIAAIPYVVIGVFVFSVMNVINGILQGRSLFAQFNILRVAGFYLFQFTPAIAVLLGVRSITTLFGVAIGSAVVWLIMSVLTAITHTSIVSPRISKDVVVKLLRFGSWSSVSGAIIPLLYDVDKILVSAFMNGAMVSVQSIVIRVYSKLFIIPEALSAVLYNQFAKDADKRSYARILEKGIRVLLAAQILPIVAAITISEPILSMWIGTQHSHIMYHLILIMLVGVWVYGPAYVPREWLTASGRPDIYAKIYAIIVIPFVVCMYFSIKYAGLNGAEWVLVTQLILDSYIAFKLTGTLPYFMNQWLWTVPAIILAYMSVWIHNTEISDVIRVLSMFLACVTCYWMYRPYLKNRAESATS